MTLFRNLFAAALVVAAFPAIAQTELDTTAMAVELGNVIGSEQYCDLAYDQDAIAKWIDGNVPADDMGFSADLAMFTQGAAFQLMSQSPSAKTAHCAAVKRTASHYGFIKQ